MVRSFVIIVLRLRDAGLKVTNNGIACFLFVLSGLVGRLGRVNTLCFGDFAVNLDNFLLL